MGLVIRYHISNGIANRYNKSHAGRITDAAPCTHRTWRAPTPYHTNGFRIMPKIYKPTAEMARIARNVLELRSTLPPSQRAGTPTGIARARDIANRRLMAAHTVWRMTSFFARHGASPGSADNRRNAKSKAAQAWALWGGNAGRTWSNNIVRDIERSAADLKRRAESTDDETESRRLMRESDRLLRELRNP